MLSLLAQAWRSWKTAKGVALLAAVALAVGIGSTTAIYTVVHAVLLKPLPYKQGDRFVALYGASYSEPGQRASSTYPDLVTYQQRTHSFDVFGWFRLSNFNLTSPGAPQHIDAIEVTPGLVRNLGVNPIIGRWFREQDGAGVAVISNSLWKRLGAGPNILDKALMLDGRKYTITGVMPAWFRLPVGGPGVAQVRSGLWVPLDPQVEAKDRISAMYFAYARLKPRVAIAEAQSDVRHVAAEIARENHLDYPYTAQLDNLRDVVISEVRPTLLLLFGAAGLLLLITCANVSGLLVARSVARAQETAIRVALGATQRQMALQYFSEGLLVSLFGAAAGVLVSFALVRTVVSLAADYIPRANETAVDWSVFLFAFGMACVASVLSSLAPLWQASRTQPNEVLSDGVRASAGARSGRISRSLVIAEIALAFTLLTVSAILITQLGNLRRVWPGFDSDHLLTFQLDVASADYGTTAKIAPYQKRLVEALEKSPGISGAALVNQLPLDGCCYSTTVFPEGRTLDPNSVQRISYLITSPGYVHTMQIPVLKGRLLSGRDTGEHPILAVINQAAARYYWPDRSPLGAYGHFSSPAGDRFQVVGIVGNVRNDGLDKPTVPEIYLSNTTFVVSKMYFVIRSPLPEKALIPEVRRAVQGVNPEQPIHDIVMMHDIATDSLSLQRVSSFMTGFFALAALLMAALGIFGVMAYSVRQRTVEIGARMALGAVSRDVLALILGGGARMAAWGLAIGAAGVAGVALLLVRRFGVHDLAIHSFVDSIAIVAVAAALASFFPAWRATLLSPMVAIRNEPVSMWESAQSSFRSGISYLVSHGNTEELPRGVLLAEFIDAARNAESFSEALHIALAGLCENMGSDSAMLLEKGPGEEYRCAAVIPQAADPQLILPANGFLLNRLRFYPAPLPLSPGDFESWLRWASERNPHHLAELQALKDTDARLVIALRAKQDIPGILLLGPPLKGSEYSAVQKRVLRSCAEQFALMMENARLTDRIVEQEKLHRDLALAAEVQRRLLPEKSPETSLGALAAVSVPARTVGGDYYDFLDVGDHRIGIALADIAGKGVAAALIMSVVHASLRIIAAEGNVSLPELAAKMNRFLYGSTRSSSYATFFYAQIDEETRQLRYVNAGHNPPYLLRRVDVPEIQIDELSTGGMIIGMFPQANYKEATVDLRSGDVLVVFTDGVTEAMNPDDEEFGEQRLKDLLRSIAHLPVQEMSTRISHELTKWIAHAPQHDDLTFIVMKVS